MKARLIRTAIVREATHTVSGVAWRTGFVAVGLLLVLVTGCDAGLSGEPPSDQKEARYEQRLPSKTSADSHERPPIGPPPHCGSVALYLAPLGYAMMEVAPTPPERAKEWARSNHPFARYAERLITFFEEADTPGPVGSVRIALRCGDKWLLVDDSANAEWDGIRGRFNVNRCMKYFESLEPEGAPPLLLAAPFDYEIQNRTELTLELRDSAGVTVAGIPPKQTRKGTTWYTWHNLLVGDFEVPDLSGHARAAGFIRHYVRREFEVLEYTRKFALELVVQAMTAPPLPERKHVRWYKDYGGRVFAYDPTTDEIAEVVYYKLDRPFVKPLEEVERLVRKGWWHEVERPYLADGSDG